MSDERSAALKRLKARNATLLEALTKIIRAISLDEAIMIAIRASNASELDQPD